MALVMNSPPTCARPLVTSLGGWFPCALRKIATYKSGLYFKKGSGESTRAVRKTDVSTFSDDKYSQTTIVTDRANKMD